MTLFDGVYIHPEPYGTALVIGAWNFPLLLTMAPVLPAIAAGNAVILKPSEISPATARAMEELIPKYLDTKCIKVQNFHETFMKLNTFTGCLWRRGRNYRIVERKV